VWSPGGQEPGRAVTQATDRVRVILGDIQKATTAAVMTTEQGNKAVEAGGKQTEAAGEAIQALLGS